jgi:hypothetical protein
VKSLRLRKEAIAAAPDPDSVQREALFALAEMGDVREILEILQTALAKLLELGDGLDHSNTLVKFLTDKIAHYTMCVHLDFLRQGIEALYGIIAQRN